MAGKAHTTMADMATLDERDSRAVLEEGTPGHEETDRGETNTGSDVDEQDVLLREVSYTSDTERANTIGDTTSRMSRTTTEDAPFIFESST